MDNTVMKDWASKPPSPIAKQLNELEDLLASLSMTEKTWEKAQEIMRSIEATCAPQSAKPWFGANSEAIRWMRDEARQWHDDKPEVAAHLFEAATMFERAAKGEP